MITTLRMIEKRIEAMEEASGEGGLSEIEYRERMKEGEEYQKALIARYNSPEEKEKREKRREELDRIGKLRQEAYSRGEPMDNYPLPWERKGPDPYKDISLEDYFEMSDEDREMYNAWGDWWPGCEPPPEGVEEWLLQKGFVEQAEAVAAIKREIYQKQY